MALAKRKQNQITELVAEFKQHLTQSADAMTRAAKAYYRALQVAPEARSAFAEAFPTVSSATWSNMVKLATGELNERLLFDGTAAGRALAKCDASIQEHYVDNPIAVSCGNGDTIQVYLDKMTSEQARQVFNHGTMRDLPEQRAWIETQRTRAKIKATRPVDPINEIFVKGKCLHVGDVKLTQQQLVKYLGQMV